MTASTRFLMLALVSWVGVRAVSLGLTPGGAALAQEGAVPPPPATGLPPIEPTEFAPLEPPAPPGPAAAPAPGMATAPATAPSYYPDPAATGQGGGWAPYYARAAYHRGQSAAFVRHVEPDTLMPEPRRLPFSIGLTPPRENPPSMAAVSAIPHVPAAPSFDPVAGAPPPVAQRRLQMSAWALLRGKPGDLLGPNSLSTNGATLGGSQAGARVTYWVRPGLAASLRTSTPLGGARGGEVALGVRYQPFRTIPIAVTAERRQRFGRAGGRNDFALFLEGGLYDRPLPAGFRLDAYGQAGVVGLGTQDLFGDGAVTFTRPLWRNISGGFGVWGGAQTGLYRLDAGPRLSIRMNRVMRIHLDYRQRLLGVASPSSGPAVTIAGDF